MTFIFCEIGNEVMENRTNYFWCTHLHHYITFFLINLNNNSVGKDNPNNKSINGCTADSVTIGTSRCKDTVVYCFDGEEVQP